MLRLTTFVAVALLSTSIPAFAQAPADSIRVGKALRGANDARIGTIDSVLADGSVRVIVESRYVVIPASTLTVANGVATTSLSRKDVNKMR